MTSHLPTVMGIGAGVLMVLAVLAMVVDQLMAAGLSFLSASLVLYFREQALDRN